ncbi:MAG: VanZ family protein [Rhodoglobus sp.]|nr:VanZ family protein [Rhodoglobus sp.]
MIARARAATARLWIAGTLLAAYLVFLLFVLFWPVPIDRGYQGTIEYLLEALHARGLSSWFGYNALEFTANVAMFVPLAFLVALLFPLRLWWAAFVICASFSISSELIQSVALPHRFGSIGDVIANSLGAAVGCLLALGLGRLFGRRFADPDTAGA